MDPDPDPGYFVNIYGIFLTMQNFQLFCLFFAYLYDKLDEPFKDKKIFIVSLFLTSQIWVLRVKKFFF